MSSQFFAAVAAHLGQDPAAATASLDLEGFVNDAQDIVMFWLALRALNERNFLNAWRRTGLSLELS